MSFDMDVSALFAPIDGDTPGGANLEYDNDFLALEQAAIAQPTQEFGNADGGERLTIEGQGADWPTVRRLALSLLQRSRDLRLAVYLMRALLHEEGFSGAHVGLSLIAGLLDQGWDYVHPQLDPDDDNDPTMRLNALAPLVSFDAVLDDLRAARLFTSRQAGPVSVRDVEVAQGKLAPRSAEQKVYTEAQLAGLFAEAQRQDAALGGDIEASVALLKQIVALLQERLGASAALDFSPLQSILQNVLRAWQQSGAASGPGSEPVAEVPSGNADGMVMAGASGAPTPSGEIRSRQDVMTALERMVQYLERAEPTNPAQLLLRRAQRVMNMSFLEAIDELAPDGLAQAERSLGGQLAKPE